MPRAPRRKQIAFAVVAVIFGLGALELLARGFFLVRALRSPTAVEDAVVNRFHPLRYELRPNSSIPANGPTARINNAGLRGVDVEVPKRRLRVYCAGDSCTFGYAPDVTDDATYPALLGRRLDPDEVEVLNGGLPSFGTLDALNFYLYRGVELQSEVIVLFVGWNDSHLCHDLDSPPAPRLPALLDQIALFRLGNEFAARLGLRRRLDLDAERARLRSLHVTDHLSDVTFARCRRLLADFVRACRDHGATPILVTLPNFTRPGWTDVDSLNDTELSLMLPQLVGGNLSPRGWRRFVDQTNDQIRSVAAELDVPLVDGASLRDPALFVDNCHLNAAGNAALADLVAVAVRAAIAP